MMVRVGSSVITPFSGSTLVCTVPMKISGRPKVKASRKIKHWRKCYCIRPPPSGPCVADWIAAGLPANGWFCIRETQSIAFLSTPGME